MIRRFFRRIAERLADSLAKGLMAPFHMAVGNTDAIR